MEVIAIYNCLWKIDQTYICLWCIPNEYECTLAKWTNVAFFAVYRLFIQIFVCLFLNVEKIRITQ